MTDFEEALLEAVSALQPNAYGMTIHDYLSEDLWRGPSYGAIYCTLERLEAAGLVTHRDGDPTPERGGRAKCFWELTDAGRRKLWEASARTVLRPAREGA